MNDLDNLISRHYEKSFSFESLVKLISEQIGPLPSLLGEEEPSPNVPGRAREITISWDGIPELQLTELAWGAATADGENPSDARTQLERFLGHVGVSRRDDIKIKLKALEGFYSRSEKTDKTYDVGKTRLSQAGINLDDPKQTIGRILGYLTFYKTLTRILQNFNASAAGFTFESFVAVLLGGEQIPTGNQTIADLTSRTGKPISLKLLGGAAAIVKGSYEDLINDLAGRGSIPVEKMEYLVCLKDISGDGPTLEGVIKFYRFYYDYDSMLDFLTATSGAYANNLRLPLGEDGVTPDPSKALKYTEPVPAYSGEQINDDGQEWWQANFEEAFKDVLTGTSGNPVRVYQQLGVAAAHDPKEAEAFREAVLHLQGEDGKGLRATDRAAEVVRLYPDLVGNSNAATIRNVKGHPAYLLSKAVNNELKELYNWEVTTAQAQRKESGASAASPSNYASIEDSVKTLRAIQASGDKEKFFNTMFNTYGYVTRKQWVINKNQIEAITKNLGQEAYLGRLFVGQAYVHEMVNMYGEILNEKVFAVFRELKVLTDSLNEFFTGGLESEPAHRAIGASDLIGEKTKKVEQEVTS